MSEFIFQVKKSIVNDELKNKLAQLDKSAIKNPWAISIWEECFKNEKLYQHFILSSNAFIEFKLESLVSYALLYTPKDVEYLELLKIFTIKEYQNQGRASKLLQNILDYARKQGKNKIFLEVHQDNKLARKFYDNLGFKTIRKVPNYYPQKKACYKLELDF